MTNFSFDWLQIWIHYPLVNLTIWSKYFVIFHYYIHRSSAIPILFHGNFWFTYTRYLIGRSTWKTCENVARYNILFFFQFQVWFKTVTKTKNRNHVEKVKCWRFTLRYHFASYHSNRACRRLKCLGPRRLVIGTKGNCFEENVYR